MFDSKLCRLCLGRQPPVSFSIFKNNITAMLEAVTATKVSPIDEISTIICLKCLINLKLSYNFQRKIKECERKLKEEFNAKVKEEPTMITAESVTITELGEVKTDIESTTDLVKLCDNNCIICGIYVNDNLINDHIRQHLKRQHKCDSCDVSFDNIQLYRQHLLQHPDSGVHYCQNCKANFVSKSLYDVHSSTVCSAKKLPSQPTIMLTQTKNIRKKAYALKIIRDEASKRRVFKLGLRSTEAIKVLLGEEKEDYTCDTCFKKFSSKKTFTAHTHKTIKCNICSREVSEYTYKRHLQDHALGPQICHLCGATLQSKSTLVTHIFYSHNNRRYKCDECGKLFKKRNARDLHMRKDHLGKPTHYCDTCGKGFYTGKFLQKHIQMTHMKLRPYICEFCKKGFSSMYALKTHTRQHTNETPYKCEICGDGFRQNVSLKAHKKSKHNITEPKTCKCKVCGKGFASTVALYAHMRLH